MTIQQGVYSSDLVLRASAVCTSSATSAAQVLSRNVVYNVVCSFTNKATDASDTLDIYVDVLVGTIWINVIHFTQALGNGTDSQVECATVGPMATDGSVIVVTSDCASGVCRGGVFGSQMRERHVWVDGGGGGASTFTYSVVAYAL